MSEKLVLTELGEAELASQRERVRRGDASAFEIVATGLLKPGVEVSVFVEAHNDEYGKRRPFDSEKGFDVHREIAAQKTSRRRG